MKTILHLVLLAILSFILIRASAQVKDLNTTSNSDPVLINGRFYVFHPPYGTEGNQFISGREFIDGSVKLKGLSYTGLKLNYDIYNQQLILKYSSKSGAANQIIVPDGWLESFTLNQDEFQLINSANGKKEIYQVIGSENTRVLYSWRKNLELSLVHGATNYVFSKPVRTMYLLHKGSLHRYKNNRGFNSYFDADTRARIREYMRKNKINTRKSDVSSMSALLDFINSIDEK
jgi:hypothetical protein